MFVFPVHIFWEFQSVSVIGVQPLAFHSDNWRIFAELSIWRIQNREALTKPVGFRTVLIPSLKPLTFLAAYCYRLPSHTLLNCTPPGGIKWREKGNNKDGWDMESSHGLLLHSLVKMLSVKLFISMNNYWLQSHNIEIVSFLICRRVLSRSTRETSREKCQTAQNLYWCQQSDRWYFGARHLCETI